MSELGPILERAVQELKSLTGFELSSVVAVARRADGWSLRIELLERRGVPDTMDLIGLYEVLTSVDGHVLQFERQVLRHRGDVEAAIPGAQIETDVQGGG